MNDHTWYNSLFIRAYPPVRPNKLGALFGPPAAEAGKGVLMGAGLPSSMPEAKSLLAQGLGLAFGIPSAYDTAGKQLGSLSEAATHPLETLSGAARAAGSIPELAAKHPFMTAGMLMGMALPGGEHIPEGEALKFGGKAFSSAERRMEVRVMAERARIHAGLEGRTGPLPPMDIGPHDTMGDWLATLNDKHLISARSAAVQADIPAIDKELARRGLKRDIADELQVLHEGKPGGLPASMFHTRADKGGQMLDLAGVRMGEPSREQQIAKELPTYLKGAQIGDIAAISGSRWQYGIKGWTNLGGKPQAKDFNWVFKKYFDQGPKSHLGMSEAENAGALMEMQNPFGYEPPTGSNVERAVEEIAGHGLLSMPQARTIVAKKISDRMKTNAALPDEITWFNIHRMGGFKPGQFKWHR